MQLDQDNFILKFTEAVRTKRTRFVNHNRDANEYSYRYYMLRDGDRVPVCQQTFLKTLLLSKNRVQGVIRRFAETCKSSQERRGGNRRGPLYAEKQASVVAYIKKFKCVESHYSREKNAKRLYLQSDLNVREMWRMYSREHKGNESLRVTESYFRTIFRTRFNIGFGTPKSDECSTCIYH